MFVHVSREKWKQFALNFLKKFGVYFSDETGSGSSSDELDRIRAQKVPS